MGIIISITALFLVIIKILMLIRIYKESVKQGWLCLLVPFYTLFFCYRRWKIIPDLFKVYVVVSMFFYIVNATYNLYILPQKHYAYNKRSGLRKYTTEKAMEEIVKKMMYGKIKPTNKFERREIKKIAARTAKNIIKNIEKDISREKAKELVEIHVKKSLETYLATHPKQESQPVKGEKTD